MALTLQEQLLKAGLTSKKKAKQVRQQKKQASKSPKKITMLLPATMQN